MALHIWQGLAAYEAGGDIITMVSPSVHVVDLDTGLDASLFTDLSGATPLANPFTANADGSIEFYTGPGRYSITVTKDSDSLTWSDIVLGLSRYDLASLSTTGTIDLADGNTFTVDASVSRTLSFVNVPTSSRSMTVVVTISGASAITWPAGIRWHGGAAPELGATWTVVVLSWDGANWSGVLGASA